MNGDHEVFEELCALLVSGQLAGDEVAELKEHVAGCGDCRRRIDEMVEVGGGLAMGRGALRMPQGMEERFVARAVMEGVPLREASADGSLRLQGWGMALVALVLVVFGSVALRGRLDSGDVAFPVASVDLPVRAEVNGARPVGEVRVLKAVVRRRGGRRSSSAAAGVSREASRDGFAELEPRFTLYSPRGREDGLGGVSRVSLAVNLGRVPRLSSEYVLPGLGLRSLEEGRTFRAPELWREDGVRYAERSSAKVALLLSLELPQSGALKEMRFANVVSRPRLSVSQ